MALDYSSSAELLAAWGYLKEACSELSYTAGATLEETVAVGKNALGMFEQGGTYLVSVAAGAGGAIAGGAKGLLAELSVVEGSIVPAAILGVAAAGVTYVGANALADLWWMGTEAYTKKCIESPEFQAHLEEVREQARQDALAICPRIIPSPELDGFTVYRQTGLAKPMWEYLKSYDYSHMRSIGGKAPVPDVWEDYEYLSADSFFDNVIGENIHPDDAVTIRAAAQDLVNTYRNSGGLYEGMSTNLDDYIIVGAFALNSSGRIYTKADTDALGYNYKPSRIILVPRKYIYSTGEVDTKQKYSSDVKTPNYILNTTGETTQNSYLSWNAETEAWHHYNWTNEYYVAEYYHGFREESRWQFRVSPNRTWNATFIGIDFPNYRGDVAHVNNLKQDGVTALTDDTLTTTPEELATLIETATYDELIARNKAAGKIRTKEINGVTYAESNEATVDAATRMLLGEADRDDIVAAYPWILDTPISLPWARTGTTTFPLTETDAMSISRADAIDTTIAKSIAESTTAPTVFPPSYIPEIPALNPTVSTGLFKVYNPTEAQVRTFGQWLWSTDISLDGLKRLFVNPMDAIIGFYKTFVTPTTGSVEPIRIGYITSNASAKTVTNQFVNVDCGSINIPEYFGNALDYDDRTNVELYLPFIGFQQLATKDVVGKTLKLKYKVDILTGSCLAYLSAGSKMIAVYSGSMNYTMPLTSGDYIAAIKTVVGVVGGIATGGALGWSKVGSTLGNAVGGSLQNIQKTGNFGGSNAILSPRKPYAIIRRARSNIAVDYPQLQGISENRTMQLSECKGYTVVSAVHVENIPKSERPDRDAIEAALKAGVIF